MMKNLLIKLAQNSWLVEVALLGILLCVTYLSHVGQLSYYHDDWTMAYDGHVGGPEIYHIKFNADRPARGIYFAFLFSLFGPAPLPYHLGGYLWRWLGAIGALWLFKILWREQRFASFSMALLFAIYPGFLLWPAVIEYQVHIASAALQVISIALTLKAMQSKLSQAIFLWAASIGIGIIAIFLVEYAIGMEVFRIACVYILTSHQHPRHPIINKIKRILPAFFITIIIPISYLFWNIFLFQGSRNLTDIRFHLHNFLDQPTQSIGLWLNYLWVSVSNSLFQAWWIPLKLNLGSLDHSANIRAILFTVFGTLIFVLAFLFFKKHNTVHDSEAPNKHWPWEAIIVGGLGVIFGLLPVIAANRFFAFRAYSHYGLPVSLGAVVFVIGLCSLSKTNPLLITPLVAVSILSHQALVSNVIREEQIIRNFWWQTFWRAPNIQNGTLLAVSYPSVYYGDDIGVVMGPSNFLYYPDQRMEGKMVHYELAAVELTPENLLKIKEGTSKSTSQYRGHTAFINFKRVLVLAQSSLDSCVHIINGNGVEGSANETLGIESIFDRSDINLIDLTGSLSTPTYFVFGSEPERGWCYYFEKADLSRQLGDWENVMELGNTAVKSGYRPANLVEWLPFLQAYAYQNDRVKANQIAATLKDDAEIRVQACASIQRMESMGYPLNSQLQDSLERSLCD